MKTVTIHQPNFMPWYPFFQKIEQADIFVILSHCQYEKGGFQNRFNIGDNWFTLSANKGLEPIVDKNYLNPLSDWQKIKNKLPEYSEILNLFDNCISEKLKDTNSKIIQKIIDLLGLKTIVYHDFPTNKTKEDRLIEICELHKADKYISGISGKNYMDLNKFKEKNIEVIFQEPDQMIKKPILQILKEKYV